MPKPIGHSLTKIERTALRIVMERDYPRMDVFAREFKEVRQRMSRALNGHRVEAEFVERLRDRFRTEVAKDPDLLIAVERLIEREERSTSTHKERLESLTDLIRNCTGYSRERCHKIARVLLTNPHKLLSVIV